MQEQTNCLEDDQNLEYLAYRRPQNWKYLRMKLEEQYEEYKANRMNTQIIDQSSESSEDELAVVQQNENKQPIKKKDSKSQQNQLEGQKQNSETILKDLSFNNSVSQESNQQAASASSNSYSSRTRRCWAQFSLYHRTFKVTLTLRQFYEFSSDILIIPFRTLEFEYEPGLFLKEMFVEQGHKLEKLALGELQILTVQKLQNYRYVAFLKVGIQLEKDLTSGIAGLIKMIALNSKKKIRTVAFPVCEKLAFIQEMMQALKNNESFNKIEELEIVYLFKKDSFFKEICQKIQQNLKNRTAI